MLFISLRSLKEKRNMRWIFENLREMFGNVLVAMQGRSINRRAIVYCLRDVHDYICFSQYNGFRSHVSVSSAQNTRAERALLSPARYRARVPFIFVGAFASEICKEVIRVHHSSSYARHGSSREAERRRRKRRREIILVFRRRKRDVRSSLRCNVWLRW